MTFGLVKKLIRNARRKGYTVKFWTDTDDDGTPVMGIKVNGARNTVGTLWVEGPSDEEERREFAKLLRLSDEPCGLPYYPSI